MKPLRLPANPEPGLVEVLHPRRARRKLLYVGGNSPQSIGRPLAHRRQCRSRHRRAEQLRHHLRQPVLRQEVGVLKVDRHACNARPVLHRCRHPLGERCTGQRAAMPAALGMRPVLGHLQRTRLGQVEDLAGVRHPCRGRRRQGRTASLAGSRNVVLHPVRVIRAAQRLALVAGLTARLAPRFAPLALGPPLGPRLLQPIARRRLGAVATAQSETAFQLLNTLDKTRVLFLQPRILLPKPGVLLLQASDLLLGTFGLCPRRRAARRLGIAHVVVESYSETSVNPLVSTPNWPCLNPLVQNDKPDNLGSYHFHSTGWPSRRP